MTEAPESPTWWASQGFGVFRTFERHGKAGDLKTATTDPDEIATWPHDWNYGIVPKAGTFGLDVDDRAALGRHEEQHGELPHTLTIETGSGGLHLWFVGDVNQYQHPKGCPGCADPRHGLDTRAAGKGYLVGPGSTHPDTGKPYRVLLPEALAEAPPWLPALYAKRANAEKTPGTDVAPELFTGDGAARVLAKLRSMRDKVPTDEGRGGGGRLELQRIARVIGGHAEHYRLDVAALAAELVIGMPARWKPAEAIQSAMSDGAADPMPLEERPLERDRSDPDPEQEEAPRSTIVRASEVEPKPVLWFWRDRIPRGGLTILDGDPDLGKTTFAIDLAARASRGELEVGPGGRAGPVVSLILSAEDSLEHVLVPRLLACRADLQHVLFPKDVHSFPGDLRKLDAYVRAYGAGLILIDPITAFLACDTHKDGEVRRALAPLSRMAERHQLAVIAIRHLKKASDGPALYRGGGTIGIIGAARAGHVVARDPDDPDRRVLAVNKSNLGPKPRSLSWRLIPPQDFGGACAVEWLGPSDLTADQLLASRVRDDGGRIDEAVEWLRAVLASGPVASDEIKKRGLADGLAWRTLRRAKDAIKARARQSTEGWTWTLT